MLARRLHATRPGSQAHKDIRYVLRLAARHGKAGQPQGRRAAVARVLQVNAWWFAAHGAPSDRIVVADPDGIISTYWEGRGFAINPVATAGRWHGLNARLTAEELAEALLPIGVYRTAGSRRFLLWEYYDVPDKPGVIRPGASGMAQGRMAQLLARAYYRTGNRRYATAARAGARRLHGPGRPRRGGEPGAAAPGRAAACPGTSSAPTPARARGGGPPSTASWSRCSTCRATEQRLASRPRPAGEGPAEQRRRERASGAAAGAALARSLADRGARTLARTLRAHDTGSWSLYGLLTPGYTWRTFQADLNYHCYHVRLLRQLDAAWPEHRFGRTRRPLGRLRPQARPDLPPVGRRIARPAGENAGGPGAASGS